MHKKDAQLSAATHMGDSQHTLARHAARQAARHAGNKAGVFGSRSLCAVCRKKRARLNIQAGALCVCTKTIARGGNLQAEAARITPWSFLGGQSREGGQAASMQSAEDSHG